jgi:hypothetical protein
LAFLNAVKRLSSTKPQGPSRTFTELQVVRALQILGERKVLGRTLLSRLLKTGPGAVRTLINILEKHKIIVVERSGCRLTEKGLNIYGQIIERIPLLSQVDAGRLSVAKFDAAVLMKDASNIMRRGIEQRDAAIRVGAKGATTLVYEDGRFVIPMGSKDCAKDFPGDVWGRLENMFHPEEGDVIIVSSADDEDIAIYGSLAGAITLLEESKRVE